jgi:hypothetical protein
MIPTLAIAALTLVSTATALPNLQRRGLPGAVYTCTSTYFSGDCQWTPPNDRCIITGFGATGIKSIGPDPDGYCVLYDKFDCTGMQYTVNFPGISGPGGIPKFTAFKCYAGKASKRAGVGIKEKELLAGGVGSADREEHKNEIEAMEQDGFSEGMIGLNKGVYY